MLPPPNHPHPQILPIDTSREDIKAQLRKSQLGSRVMFLQKVWKVWEALELGEGSQLGSFVMFLQKVSGVWEMGATRLSRLAVSPISSYLAALDTQCGDETTAKRQSWCRHGAGPSSLILPPPPLLQCGDETTANRQLAGELVQAWSRPIFYDAEVEAGKRR